MRKVRTSPTRSPRKNGGATFEILERRRLLSATIASPIAYPLDGTLADGTTTPTGYSPAQIKSIYGIDKVTLNGIVGNGTGQTIAIVLAHDDPDLVSSTNANFSTSDLHLFDQQFGIADPPSFIKVEQFADGSYPSVDTGWAEEASLDVEWSHAIAPGAKILLIEAHDPTATSLLNFGVKTAAATNGVSVVNTSFGFSEFSGEISYDADFQTPPGHSGVTFVASSGDDGAPGNYPAFSPNVVAVGGTTLSSASISSETAYASSGGGISTYESKPAYQSTVKQSATNRTIPDVSFDANPNTGVSVYDSYNGGFANKWYKIGGTSLAAPAWAGLIAIADQGRAGAKLSMLDGKTQTLPSLYSISASDFHDITSGNNGFAAGVGYDLVTGRGSPIANLLEPALAGVPTTAPVSAGAASIAGEIYVDANNNAKLDTGEIGLSGVKVYLDLNKNGVLDSNEPSITTGTGGAYSFTGLGTGTWRIREVIPTTYKLTTPALGYVDVGVQNGWHITGENFGNESTAVAVATPKYNDSVSGYAYVDTNKNSKLDTGEAALSGITFFIDANNDGKLDNGEESTTTNSLGYYYLGEFAGGTFRVREILPAGDKLTNPTVGYYDVPLKGGWNVKNQDFGNLKL